jgi:hypothetical protein
MADLLYVLITLLFFGACGLLVIAFDKLMENKK